MSFFDDARPALAALLCAGPLVGCTTDVGPPTNTVGSSTTAVLSVERSTCVSDPTVAPRAHASAYFIRVPAGVDSLLAARLVGAALALPAVGECQAADSLWNRTLPLASLAPVDLIDVGQVSMVTREANETMAARAFPDVIDLVSGVVYTSRDQVADFTSDQERYVFRISGSASFPRMALGATAPSPPAEIEVGGLALESAAVTLPRRDLSVRWKPEAGAGLIYVDIVPNEDGPLDRVRCTFADDGKATIPQAMLPHGGAQTIIVHRVVHARAQALDWDPSPMNTEAGAFNLDGVEIRFDLATKGGLRLETAVP